ncbi:MAG: YraN family protein [Planctomycetaceae bacterium]|nr:YraN family protein [Planctomycetaceae bacterium]MCB9953947.1 YraN family protein [Planctomycetaceae bacterium]
MLPVGWLRKLFGDRGENLAAKFLRNKGYKILARQSRNFVGEIDIIASHGERIVFVEVKTRTSNRAGHPAEAVTTQKQKQIGRAALVWLKRNNLLDRGCRYDVIAITWQDRQDPLIEHFESAFAPPIDW